MIGLFKKQYTPFSKEDTQFFKGVAILLIIAHNYFHIIPGYNLENENSFDKENIFRFIEQFLSFDFKQMLASLFAFFGHYGVQLFVFFSAYGVTIQYIKRKLTYKKYVTHRLKKIYFLMSFGILAALLIYWVVGTEVGSFDKVLLKYLILSSTLSGFSYGQMYNMLAGPFWFFALIIQFYILFPLIFKQVNKETNKILYLLLLLSYSLSYALHFTKVGENWILMGDNSFGGLTPWGNIIGHLPEFLLGIFMAKNGLRSFKPWFVLLALVGFIASQFSAYFFPFSFLCMLIVLLYLVGILNSFTKSYFRKGVLFTGQISMILFAINGPLRGWEFLNLKSGLESGIIHFPVYLLTLFCVAYLFYLLYSFLLKILKI